MKCIDVKEVYNLLIPLFGIRLRKIEYSDLEKVALWRNNDIIRKFMNDRRKVNKQILTVWINKVINSTNSLAFIILNHENIPSGVLEFKNINTIEASCEQGIFLAPEKIGTGLGKQITLYQEYILNKLNIYTIYLNIRNSNIRNITFWNKLGATLCRKDNEFLLFKSEKEIRREKLRHIAYVLQKGEIWDSLFTKK